MMPVIIHHGRAVIPAHDGHSPIDALKSAEGFDGITGREPAGGAGGDGHRRVQQIVFAGDRQTQTFRRAGHGRILRRDSSRCQCLKTRVDQIKFSFSATVSIGVGSPLRRCGDLAIAVRWR